MSFSNYTIYCAMQFCKTQYMVFLYHPVQRTKAVSEAVKGILKGRNSSFSNLHTLVRRNNETIIDETARNRST